VWEGVLRQAIPGLDEATARSAAHAVFGLLNSTPRLRDRRGGLSDRDEVAALLRRMALAALRDLSPRLPPSPAPSGSGRG
jgi:AcrR family transcriptional regulator